MINITAGGKAINMIGYENITGPTMRDALANLEIDVGVIPPTTMTDEKLWFNDYLRVTRVEEGKLMTVGDWLKNQHS